ncbi:MAG: hypothetical protein ACT6S0_19680 [Roseateles sp.]|uniref:hypothetical protein n=1 Tax=Roseateles sp. TaxID=1971397 RepID=UPI00403625DE
MRLESYNVAPFDFESAHAEDHAFAPLSEAPLTEAPVDAAPSPAAADEAPGEVLRNMARQPPAYALLPRHRPSTASGSLPKRAKRFSGQ